MFPTLFDSIGRTKKEDDPLITEVYGVKKATVDIELFSIIHSILDKVCDSITRRETAEKAFTLTNIEKLEGLARFFYDCFDQWNAKTRLERNKDDILIKTGELLLSLCGKMKALLEFDSYSSAF